MLKGSVLIVDDDEDILELFKKILEEEDYFVETATTGQQAINKANESRFDLALLDIVLPDIEGDKVAIELKNLDGSIAILFVTGYSRFQYCINALDIGVFDILLKPISSSELLNAIENALSLRAQAKSVL